MTKTALVTGASSGLGRELVRQLVRDRGMTVVATARRRDRLEALAAEMPDGRVVVVPGDLTDAEFRRQLWECAEALPGGLDVLVNNAGMGHYAELADEDPATISRMIELNLVALIDLTRRAAAYMKARRSGQIVQVSSVLGFVGFPYCATYVATKHAVNGLTRSLRYELRGTGVRVWAACPGRTQSEFSEVALGARGRAGAMPRGESTEKVVRAIVRGLDGGPTFLLPTPAARAVVLASRWLGGPYEWWMGRWAPRYFRETLNRARLPGPPRPSAP